MAFRFQWILSNDGLELLSEPYLSFLTDHIRQATVQNGTVYPRLYFSYDARTNQTTIVTTDLNQLHLSMIHHIKRLLGTPVESTQLLIKCFIVVQECFGATALSWDKDAAHPVYCGMPLNTLVLDELTTSSQQEMASRIVDSGADHNYKVRVVEGFARYADMMRGDFHTFKDAVVSLEQYLQNLWSLLNLDSNVRESLGASFVEQRKRGEVIGHLLGNIVSRCDRFLNLVSYLHPHANGWYIQEMLQLLNYTSIRMVEQNAKMTADMKELAKQNAEQVAQSVRQAQSMAVLAYDTKRDSEVMKAITVVTLIFLPPTFISVCPIPCLEFTTYPILLFQTIFSMGFFNFGHDQVEVSRQGWIYLACALPLTFVVVGASFAWIWWTGKREEKPIDYSTAQVLAQAADTLRLGVGPRKEGI
jgi:hypothetical protein